MHNIDGRQFADQSVILFFKFFSFHSIYNELFESERCIRSGVATNAIFWTFVSVLQAKFRSDVTLQVVFVPWLV
jgi:hypothetical protein